MRRSVTVDPEEVVASLAHAPFDGDEVATAILDSAAHLYGTIGVRRCSIEDIAEHSGVGRTTIYRRFDGRQQILEAVLGREIRRFFALVIGPATRWERFDDVIVESFVAGLVATETSLLATLVRAEPELLSLLTIDGSIVVEAGRSFLLELARAVTPDIDLDAAAVMTEILIRLAISLVLTPSTMFPLDDPDTARASLHRVIDPLLATMSLGELQDSPGTI